MKSIDDLDVVEAIKFGGYVLSGMLLESAALIGAISVSEKNPSCSPESKIIIGGSLILGSIVSYACSKNYERIRGYFNNRINKKIDKKDIPYSY